MNPGQGPCRRNTRTWSNVFINLNEKHVFTFFFYEAFRTPHSCKIAEALSYVNPESDSPYCPKPAGLKTPPIWTIEITNCLRETITVIAKNSSLPREGLIDTSLLQIQNTCSSHGVHRYRLMISPHKTLFCTPLRPPFGKSDEWWLSSTRDDRRRPHQAGTIGAGARAHRFPSATVLPCRLLVFRINALVLHSRT